MPADIVVTFVSEALQELGFRRRRKQFVRELNETLAIIDIQNNSFGRNQHFLNLTIEFKEEVATRLGLKDRFATWTRVENIDESSKLVNLAALDAGSDMGAEQRETVLYRVLKRDLPLFLETWSDSRTAGLAYRAAIDKPAPVNGELVARWLTDSLR